MTTEHQPTQAEHAALFRRVAEHLAVSAGKLASIDGEVQLTPEDIGSLFITTGFLVVATERGRPAAIAYLRSLAGAFERGNEQVTSN